MRETLIDIHCHCLPGVDDGPADMRGAIDLCRQLAAEGVSAVCATPHQLGRYEGGNSPGEIRLAVAELSVVLDREGIPLRVLPGADVRLAEDLPERIAADGVLTLGDRRGWILLEFSDHAFMDIEPLLHRLSTQGIRGIISHPERYPWSDAMAARMLQWRRTQKVLVQLTAGSLLGAFGPRAQGLSWNWLEGGVADIVASDAHNLTARPPRLKEAFDAIVARLGRAVAQRVMHATPAKVLHGADVTAGALQAVEAREP